MHGVAWWPTLSVVVIASIADLRFRIVPNWLVFPFMLSGLAVSSYLGGWSGAVWSLLGLALGVAACGVLVALHALGMGDLKLCAAIGCWIGPAQLATSLIFTGLAGGIIGIAWAVYGGFWRELIDNSRDLLLHIGKCGLRAHPEISLRNGEARKMPYAPAIAIGTVMSFLAM